jgi:hypothetical protein
VGISLNVIHSNWKLCEHPNLNLRMALMEQNVDANGHMMKRNNKTMTVVKKNAYAQASRYWRHPYAQSQLLKPNLRRQTP